MNANCDKSIRQSFLKLNIYGLKENKKIAHNPISFLKNLIQILYIEKDIIKLKIVLDKIAFFRVIPVMFKKVPERI